MVTIRFDEWDEFLEELKANPPKDRVVRLSASLRTDVQGVLHVSLVAGYADGAKVVECGEYLGLYPADPSRRAAEIRDLFVERKRGLEELGFRVSAGRYEVRPVL